MIYLPLPPRLPLRASLYGRPPKPPESSSGRTKGGHAGTGISANFQSTSISPRRGQFQSPEGP